MGGDFLKFGNKVGDLDEIFFPEREGLDFEF